MSKFNEGFISTMKSKGCTDEDAKAELEGYRSILKDEVDEMENDYEAGCDAARDAASYWDE
ncbi:hypothetical protein FWP33_07430 [Vibrio parahaemolyticus]|jgi:hypothetical protein|nr:hypothetical protein [Vibrio parahaemolyticus]ELA8176582.1 hypothetical protein [Vibrio alginolyticus]EJC7176015.1 hypothetical protein [Vibrio parahaemolyticus]EJE4724453.1 hypothetical protein [Vibrio parahaemolyticus]EJG0009748.1 hypothetical protein [Vibrio parahaemolyticus]